MLELKNIKKTISGGDLNEHVKKENQRVDRVNGGWVFGVWNKAGKKFW